MCMDDLPEDDGKPGQVVASPAVQWCNAKAIEWLGNPWDIFMGDKNGNEVCQFYAPKEGDIGTKQGCNYYERAFNSCYWGKAN